MKLLIVSQGLKTFNYTSIGKSVSQSLKNLNINFELFDLSLYFNRYTFYLVRKTPLLYKYFLKRINSELARQVFEEKYTHVLVIKGAYLLPETIKIIKNRLPSITFSCFNPDDPFNEFVVGAFPQINESIREYDSYFIWNRDLVPKIKETGVKLVDYLPFVVNTSLVYPIGTPKKFDVSLISAVDSERQFYVNNIIESLKSRDEEMDFNIFGKGWLNAKGVSIYPPVYGSDFNKTMASSKINLNILRLQNKNSINMRTFEVPANASFALHETSEEAKEFFVEDKEMVFFNNAEELLDKCSFYLKKENLREKIALRGYERIIKSDYTYSSWVKKYLKIIQEY